MSAKIGRTWFWLLLAAFFVLATACDDESPTDDPQVEVDPGVQLYEFDADPAAGYGPLDVDFSLRFVTDDPRARVDIYIDFGDGNSTQEQTYSSLGDFDEENLEVEEIPEERNFDLQHTYQEPGNYTAKVYLIDVTNSTEGDEEQEAVEIRSLEQSIDIEVLALPDLIAVDVSSSVTEISLDESFNVDFQIINNGSDIQNPFEVDLYLVARNDLSTEELADASQVVKLTVVRSSDGLEADGTFADSAQVVICSTTEGDCDKIASLVSEKVWYPRSLCRSSQ